MIGDESSLREVKIFPVGKRFIW